MPSASGSALRMLIDKCDIFLEKRTFLCPHLRVGLSDFNQYVASVKEQVLLCPRFRAGL
jgi:hypothetical protein